MVMIIISMIMIMTVTVIIILMIIDAQELDENVMEGLTSALLNLTTDNSPRWLVMINY